MHAHTRDLIQVDLELAYAHNIHPHGWPSWKLAPIPPPHPADALFTPRARQTYDAALAMYHDQALVPLKALDFDEGVNVTLGLPFIRTSPDHGTAFDIAGTGTANPTSTLAALRLARRMALARTASA